MFKVIFVTFLAGLLVIDLVFLPKPSRRAWHVLFIGFVLAALTAFYPEPLFVIADALGLGRPVDAVIYVSTVILVREIFISRSRVTRLESTITRLTRNIAIADAKTVRATDAS